MITVSVLYPKTGESRFDMDYYLNNHTPMLKERMGSLLKGVQIDEGIAGMAPDQPATYAIICRLSFDSLEDFQKGMAAHGAEILADIANYTNVQPVVQINRPIDA